MRGVCLPMGNGTLIFFQRSPWNQLPWCKVSSYLAPIQIPARRLLMRDEKSSNLDEGSVELLIKKKSPLLVQTVQNRLQIASIIIPVQYKPTVFDRILELQIKEEICTASIVGA